MVRSWTYNKRILLLLPGIFLSLFALSADEILDIAVPKGYERIVYPADSFSGWIQRLPLKADSKILTHTGKYLTDRMYNRLGVLDLPLLFSEDLEQCADYCMRMWADYHKESDQLDSMFLYSYGGEKQYFASSGLSYIDFLYRAFNYSNTHSLKAGSLHIEEKAQDGTPNLRPGDMIVQNDTGGIGHVSMIVDSSEDESGNRLYLVGFSFMPAQEFHIEEAVNFPSLDLDFGKEGWFSYEGYLKFLDEFLPFGEPVPIRFE